jgi:hypothetical protein
MHSYALQRSVAQARDVPGYTFIQVLGNQAPAATKQQRPLRGRTAESASTP